MMDAGSEEGAVARREVAGVLTAKRHQTLFRAGSNVATVYQLERGWAARAVLLNSGVRHISALLMPGDICNPETAVLGHIDYDVIALTTVELRPLKQGGDREDGAENQIGTLPILTQVLQELSLVRKSAAVMTSTSASQRVAFVLQEIARRQAGDGVVQNGVYLCPLTQSDLGEITSMTSVHCNRKLRELKDVVVLQTGSLTIIDAARLSKLAAV